MQMMLEWYRANSAMIVRCLAIIFVIWPAVFVIRRILKKWLEKRLSAQALMLILRTFTYSCSMILIVMLLKEMGFNLSALLGAAGVAGIAIGFAAQTSLSNLISGIFLLWEKPFKIGDLVNFESQSGIIYSMELLAVNIRTFDNRLIRIPNENLVKGTFVNVTRFPIRRHDLTVGVAYKEDIATVTRILKEVADLNPACLDEPEPVVIFQRFADSSLEFLLGVWCAKEDYLKLRNSIPREVKERFDKEGIEIPFPHISLYAGQDTRPFPVKMDTTEADVPGND